jgi:hypothetical protein
VYKFLVRKLERKTPLGTFHAWVENSNKIYVKEIGVV